jgi:nucleoside-diphosphate-sugar epimerase
MKIFVTGATGVVGKRLIPALLAEGHQVTGVARSPAKAEALGRSGAAPVQIDLFDRDAVAAAVRGHDEIINLATHIPPGNRMFFPGAWSENDRIRRQVSRFLVDAALEHGIARFIQESFAPIYPSCGEAWIDETTAVQPARYNRSVVDAEAAVARFNVGGATGIVLRFALFYGPDSDYARTTLRSVRKGRAPSFGPADAYMSSISHDDAAAAVSAVLGAPAGIYNVTDDEPLRRREYFDSLAAVLGVPPPRFLPAWMARLTGELGETLSRSQRISNAKLRETCGWVPRYPSMREGWRSIVTAAG